MTRVTRIMRAATGRAALVVWSFIAPALLLPACAERASNSDNSDAKAPVAVTERGVEILELERDEARRTVAATVVDHETERRVTLAPLLDGPSPGFTARIDDDGSFFEVSIAVDEQSGEMWIREHTAVDEMTIARRATSERIYESYEINGERLTLSYPAFSETVFEKATAKYRAGTFDAGASPELQELGDALAKFDAFYTPTVTNTLHDSADGELLMSLLNDPTMAGLVTGEEITPDRVDGPMSRFCWGALTCMTFKCKLGGMANSICVACTGATVACVIMEIACWYAGCDCCF